MVALPEQGGHCVYAESCMVQGSFRQLRLSIWFIHYSGIWFLLPSPAARELPAYLYLLREGGKKTLKESKLEGVP